MTGRRLFKKSIGGIIGLSILICAFGYIYIANNVHDPFTIDGSMTLTESYASQFVGKDEQYHFRLINVSDKTVKLDNMQLHGYSGIQIGQLEINDKPVGGQLIPSDRRGTGTSWVATSRHSVSYMVDIENSKIHNPTSVLITYSYLGMKHTQNVQLPGIHN